MSWEKECKIKTEKNNIIVEYILEPILSSTPIKNISLGDKVRINTSDVRNLLLEKGYKIQTCIESPRGGEIRNYFYEYGDLILGRWVFEKVSQTKPRTSTKKEKNVKKKVANSDKV